MLADEKTLQPGLYRLPDDPVGPRVLIPAFRSSTSVQGGFGWFTAGWIGRLAPGLAEYLNRDDTGPIEFTVSPQFFPAEAAALEQAQAMSPDEAGARVADVFVNGRVDAAALAAHAIDCLAWMVAAGALVLRVAVPKAASNYHPKLWLFGDGEEHLIVRGSANATGVGLGAAVEHLDVDVSWIPASRERVVSGRRMLEDWRHARSAGIDRVVDLDEALRSRIVDVAPDAPPRPEDYDQAARRDDNPRWAVDRWQRAAGRRTGRAPRPRLVIPDGLNWRTGRYGHQREAVEAWEAGPNPERGTISMATGAGKTVTALICAARCQQRLDPDTGFAVVISAPSVPLILQWKEEVARFGVTAAAPTLGGDRDRVLTNWFRSLRAGGTQVMVVTNNLLCSDRFRTTMAAGCRGAPTLLIADEAHRLGAAGFTSATPDFFERRLALSATPVRQYDPDGTERIFAFFGPVVYTFGLDRAIGFCLTCYDYLVHAAALAEDELEDFVGLTKRIGRAMALAEGADGVEDERLQSLLLARRRIVENAAAKLPLLREVLRLRDPGSLRQALIYASSKNPAQFEEIGALLSELGVRWAPVTQETTSRRKELARTFEAFANGGFQVLLAKRVLDEGVDIPSVREAFILASSTVEREWVQRRGRVLRRHPGKTHAVVHDFLALPPAADPIDDAVQKIVADELGRAHAFAAHARNGAGADGALTAIARLKAAWWPDPAFPEPVLQRPGEQLAAPGRQWRKRTQCR